MQSFLNFIQNFNFMAMLPTPPIQEVAFDSYMERWKNILMQALHEHVFSAFYEGINWTQTTLLSSKTNIASAPLDSNSRLIDNFGD